MTNSEPTIKRALNPALENLQPSATLAINERSAELVEQGNPLCRLGFGQSPFPVPEALVEELQRQAYRNAYLPTQGLPALREAVSAYMLRTESMTVSPAQVMIGPGTKELMFLLQLVHDADLLLPAPSWVSYEPQAKILGRRVHWLPGNLALEPDLVAPALDELCRSQGVRSRLLVLNYPGNPTGGGFSPDQLVNIAEVAQRHRVLVLSDEIYSGLNFRGEHQSIARYYPQGTIVCNGLSKWCSAGGWRVGAFVFPGELSWLKSAMITAASETFSAVCAPIQYASIVAFEGGAAIEQYTDRARRIMHALTGYCWRRLTESGAQGCTPIGGFYLFPIVEAARERFGVHTSAEFCRVMLDDAGVAALPGSEFGRPDTELSVRLACVDFNGARAMDALIQQVDATVPDEEFLAEYCAPTVTGINRLCDWLGDS